MSTMKGLAKYLAFARIGATQARRDRGELYGRVVFFAVIHEEQVGPADTRPR
jgi:hypothetical protein